MPYSDRSTYDLPTQARLFRNESAELVRKSKVRTIQALHADNLSGAPISVGGHQILMEFVEQILSEIVEIEPIGLDDDDPAECFAARIILARDIVAAFNSK